jgi:polyisoprenoid-binding protein YceI
MMTRICFSSLMLALSGVSQMEAQRTARMLDVDVASSRIYVVTHRSGLLSFLGHEHAILSSDWNASLCWDAPTHAGSNAQFSVDATTLTIDADSARQLAGLGGGPSTAQRARIHTKMQRSLAVTDHKTISFVSDSVRTRAGRLTLFGRLTIKGKTNPIDMPITVDANDSRISFVGHTTFRQSAFGIQPESIAGVVKVADRADLHVRLHTTLSPSGCP